MVFKVSNSWAKSHLSTFGIWVLFSGCRCWMPSVEWDVSCKLIRVWQWVTVWSVSWGVQGIKHVKNDLAEQEASAGEFLYFITWRPDNWRRLGGPSVNLIRNFPELVTARQVWKCGKSSKNRAVFTKTIFVRDQNRSNNFNIFIYFNTLFSLDPTPSIVNL